MIAAWPAAPTPPFLTVVLPIALGKGIAGKAHCRVMQQPMKGRSQFAVCLLAADPEVADVQFLEPLGTEGITAKRSFMLCGTLIHR